MEIITSPRKCTTAGLSAEDFADSGVNKKVFPLDVLLMIIQSRKTIACEYMAADGITCRVRQLALNSRGDASTDPVLRCGFFS